MTKKLPTEVFKCNCGKKLKGRKTVFDSNYTVVCPDCGQRHCIDVYYVDWIQANQSKSIGI